MLENRKIWEEIFENKEWGKYPPIALVRFVARNFYHHQNRQEIKFLELGCGTGANLWYLAREGFTVSGIDFSLNAINRLKDRLRKEGLIEKVEQLLVGDYIDEIGNFKDNYFDCIIDIESLVCNSISNKKAIIKSVFSKLKPGGLFFSMHFERGCYGSESAIYDQEKDMYTFTEGPLKDTGWISLIDVDTAKKIYTEQGFKIEFIHREIYQYDIEDETKSMRELIICLRKP